MCIDIEWQNNKSDINYMKVYGIRLPYNIFYYPTNSITVLFIEFSYTTSDLCYSFIESIHAYFNNVGVANDNGWTNLLASMQTQ